jgi:hypothetical protein
MFSAYLDNTLSLSQRQEFEALLTQDTDLRAELEMAQLIRQQMQEMPRRSLPRSFTLDASVYGVPKKEPLVQAYPFLRVATVMTAFFFVLALGLNVFTSQSGGDMASVAQTAMEPAPALEAPMPEAENATFAATEEALASAKVAETVIVVEAVAGEEEAAAGMAAAATMLPTATATATAVPLTEDTAMADGAVEEGLPAASALAGVAGGESALSAPVPTATVSALPRPDATETAVSRVVEPTLSAQDEIVNADDMETAVTQETPPQNLQQPRLSLTNSQWLLMGLGLLLLILIVITFLARRKI